MSTLDNGNCDCGAALSKYSHILWRNQHGESIRHFCNECGAMYTDKRLNSGYSSRKKEAGKSAGWEARQWLKLDEECKSKAIANPEAPFFSKAGFARIFYAGEMCTITRTKNDWRLWAEDQHLVMTCPHWEDLLLMMGVPYVELEVR